MERDLTGQEAFDWYTTHLYMVSVADALRRCKSKIDEDTCWNLFLESSKTKGSGVRLK